MSVNIKKFMGINKKTDG